MVAENLDAPPPEDPQPEPSRPWLLMLHLSATAPNLEDPLKVTLEELSQTLAATTMRAPQDSPDKRVYVVVQIDGPSGIYRRYWIKRDGHEFLGGGRSEGQILREFVVQTSKRFVAERRALVLWGHSAGVAHNMEVPLGLFGAQPTKTAAASSASSVAQAGGPAPEWLGGLLGGFLAAKTDSVGGLWQDLKDLGKTRLHILGFDACFMASIEIAYELREVARFLLAPQAAISLRGWHYDLLLQHILHNDRVVTGRGAEEDALTLGRAVVEQVGLARSSPETLTLLDLARAKDLIAPLKGLFGHLWRLLQSARGEAQVRQRVLGIFNQAIWAGARQFLDLADLCRLLASRVPDQKTRDQAVQVLELLARTEVVNGTARAARLVVDQLSMLDVPLGGVSLFCPWPRATLRETGAGVRNAEINLKAYLLLEFVRDTDCFWLFFHPDNYLATERAWIRHELKDGARALAAGLAAGRVDDPKPASRVDDPKPAGRVDDPKPAGRGDSPGAGRERP